MRACALIVAMSALATVPASAQYKVNHGTSNGFQVGEDGFLGKQPAQSSDWSKLQVFGRCVVRRDYAASVSLADAYPDRDAVDLSLDRMRPALTQCRKASRSGLAASPRWQIAAIGDALRERGYR